MAGANNGGFGAFGAETTSVARSNRATCGSPIGVVLIGSSSPRNMKSGLDSFVSSW